MVEFTPLSSSIGGIIIGLAAAGLYHFAGKILGVSNITSELMNHSHRHKAWRLIFTAGILCGGLLLLLLNPSAVTHESPRTIMTLIVAGLLVGYGSSLGRGCTSGSALSGMAVMSLGGILTMFAIFGAAYALAFFVRRLWVR